MATITNIIYIMKGELQAERPIKLFSTPNHAKKVGHAFIWDEPIEPKDMYQQSVKRKPKSTFYY